MKDLKQRDIQENAQVILPSGYSSYRSFLKALYEKIKSQHPDFSYKKMAVLLGFKPTNIIFQYIKDIRPLTLKSAVKIAGHLGLTFSEKKYFLKLVEFENASDPNERDEHFAELIEIQKNASLSEIDKKWMKYFNKWYYPVIREMIQLPNFQEDPEWIAKTIVPSIRVDEARKAVDLLLELNLISRNSEGNLQVVDKSIKTPKRVRNLGLINYHGQMLDLAKNSLTEIKGKDRNISAITVMVDQQKLDMMKLMMYEFQSELMNLAEETETGDQVVQVNLQLFPVSKKEKS